MLSQSEKSLPLLTGKLLHIGCGRQTKENLPAVLSQFKEIRLDIDESVDPDVVADMRDLSMFEDESFDVIYSFHNMEYLFFHEVLSALIEWHRILKPKGLAVIMCSDLKSVCEFVAKKGLTDPLYRTRNGSIITPIDILYGHTDFIRKGSQCMAHKTGFTADLLQDFLQRAGFSQQKVHQDEFELIASAYK